MSGRKNHPAKKAKLEIVTKREATDYTDETEEECKYDIKKHEERIRAQEIEQLREFKVLDEVKSNDEDDSNDDNSETSSIGLPDEELDKMLDENLPDDFKSAPKQKDKTFVTRTKLVMEEKGVNQFENLPLDWMMLRHYSGIPIYMHRTTRVCTVSKPYFIGKGNTRKHDIPISAIPCLLYRRALEEEEKQEIIDNRIQEQIKNKTYTDQGQAMDERKRAGEGGTGGVKTEKKETANVGSKDDLIKKIDIETRIYTQSKCPFLVPKKEPGVEEPKDDNDNDDEIIIEECHFTMKIEPDDSDDEPSVKREVDAEEDGNENEGGDETPRDPQPVVLPGGIVMPPPRVESVNTSWKTKHLTPQQVNEYCKRLFKFKKVNIMHFKRWADRRKYCKARKTLQYPTLPAGTTLITIPAQQGSETGGKTSKRDWVMNMNGRSYLSVFHEYVCRALQKQPVYQYKQIDNAATPYQAMVFIGGMQYGVGYGSSKRQAKYAAARASIHILIPEMKDHLEAPAGDAGDADGDFTFFDYVSIEDPRIAEFCAATCEPSPHAILRTCLLRNFGAGDRHIHTEMRKLEYQKTELTMKVGKHTATVVCKNKKTAKQRASQAILQALHPHVRSWGSLLRLYGSRSVKSCKEKKTEEQQITLLQDKARRNEPNYAVLEKLRNEMMKLRERDEAVVPIGTLLLNDDPPTHSGSDLNNVDL